MPRLLIPSWPTQCIRSALIGVQFLLALLALNIANTSSWAGVQEPPDETLREMLKTAINSSDSFSDRYDAEVWLVSMSSRLSKWMPETEKRLELLKHVHYEASRANLQPELVLAVIDVESRFDRFAISKAGALGLMQVMPFWLKEIGRPNDNLFDTRTNLRFGCTILRYYLDLEDGNLTRALARYNGSLNSHKYTNLVFRAFDKRWRFRY